MEVILDGWTMVLATTALAGTILTLIVLVMGKYRNGQKVNAKFLWLLWVSPKEIKMFTVIEIFLIITYEILFGGEIIICIYSLIINGDNEIVTLSSWCGIMMFIYILITSIYVTFLSYNAKHNNRIQAIIKVFNKEVFECKGGNIQVGGGGAMKPMIDGMLLLSVLLLLIRIKQVFIMLCAGDISLSLFITIAIILVIMIWLVLVKSEKLQSMTVNKGKLVYRNWFGKLDYSTIDEIKRIEENGAYIFFFKNEKEIFAKFIIFTKGINELLDEELENEKQE